MANTLTNLTGIIYKALDTVSREIIGFIPAVLSDFDTAERAAKGQSVNFLAAGEVTAGDTTPAAYGPSPSDMSEAATTITINKSRSTSFYLTGEEVMGLENSASRQMLVQGKFAQAMRTLVNEIETDLFTVAKEGASRAYGTAGTTPFGTAADLSDLAQVGLILDDNGAPTTDRHVVLNNLAIANLRAKQANLFNSGPELLQRGILTELEGFFVHQSGKITKHTKGTGSAYQVNNAAGYAVKSTDITVDTGSGTILKGDILTNTKTARDTNKYVVGTALAGNVVKLNKPGNQVAWGDNDPLAVGADYTGNFAFYRNAIWLAVRPPAVPEGGDSADDSMIIVDPVTGLLFEVRVYRQISPDRLEVAAAWGTAAVKSDQYRNAARIIV
jgi:hypothetical protein